MTSVRGLNHVTLAVRDVSRAVQFYVDGLGLTLRKRWQNGAYLEAGELWLCLSQDDAARSTQHDDYTHVAFDVSLEEFAPLATQIKDAGGTSWKENRSEGDSFYFLDPDGHKLEIHAGTLASRLAAMSR
jgi:catechol 2,3-dioxygenase-like lactoylglutathione lyase family enzyme